MSCKRELRESCKRTERETKEMALRERELKRAERTERELRRSKEAAERGLRESCE